MNTIKNNIANELIIKKSKFITKLYRLNTINDIHEILNNLKKEYNDSTHICYSYIFDNNIKAFDDKEPQGTAGNPILNILKINNLNHIMCVVIRYFGGVKLGANGLIHAYSNSIKEALNLTKIIELKKYLIIEMEFFYNESKIIDSILKNYEIISKEFDLNIKYIFKIDENNYNVIKDILVSKCVNLNIIRATY